MEEDVTPKSIAGSVATKQKGVCPFCANPVLPLIVKANYIRRDQCRCPECNEIIYLCRTLGCHDFAKGTSVYDHEMCPSCTQTASGIASEIGKTALKVGGTIATSLIVAALTKGSKGK